MSFGLLQYSLMLAAWLALALVLAMTSMGRKTDLPAPTLKRCFADPWLALSIGILFTFATAPLVWAYYHVFALIPIFAFFRPREKPGMTAWVALCYLAMANPLLEWLGSAGLVPLIPIIMLWAWTPLLVVVLGEVVNYSLVTGMADGQNAGPR